MNGDVQYLQSHSWQTAVHTKHNLALGNPQSSGQQIKMAMDGGESHTLLSLIVHRLSVLLPSVSYKHMQVLMDNKLLNCKFPGFLIWSKTVKKGKTKVIPDLTYIT